MPKPEQTQREQTAEERVQRETFEAAAAAVAERAAWRRSHAQGFFNQERAHHEAVASNLEELAELYRHEASTR